MEREEIITKNKIHPHKLTLWIGIGSIVMMFAGLTSACIVKRNQAGWVTYDLPNAFWYSTIVILLSSGTIYLADKAFRSRSMVVYRRWMSITALLGVAFMVVQYVGFKAFWAQGMTLQANVSYSFLYVIVGLHALHVAGGVITLIVMSLMAFSKKKRVYSSVPVELVGTYWHFVDLLWIYLLIFLILIK
jgi:cytochrome c oxidase subunit 3